MSQFIKPSGATVASGTIKQPSFQRYTSLGQPTLYDGSLGTYKIEFGVSSSEGSGIFTKTTSGTHSIFTVNKNCQITFSYRMVSVNAGDYLVLYKNGVARFYSGTAYTSGRDMDMTFCDQANIGDYYELGAYNFAAALTNLVITAESIEESTPNFTVSLPASKDNNKTYDQTQVSVTGAGWTTTSAKFYPVRTIDKVTQLPKWWLSFNVQGTTSSVTSFMGPTVAGITLPVIQAVSASFGSNGSASAADLNTVGTFSMSYTSAVSTHRLNGFVELASKPTWADEWIEPGVFVGNVPREQVAIVQYRGNGTRTTLSTTPVAMPLTNVKGDTSIVSLTTGTNGQSAFTLQAGEYDIYWQGLHYSGGVSGAWVKHYLYNVTDTVEVERGMSTYTAANSNYLPAIGTTKISITKNTTFETRWLTATGNVYLGDTQAAPDDVNGFIKIRKLA